MHFAAARGDVEIFQDLVESYHPDLTRKDVENHTPFLTAVVHKNLDLVKYLVEKCGQSVVEETGGQPGALHLAANNNDLDTINYLLDKGANIEQKSDFAAPLNWAVGAGNVKAALLLLDRGANPNGDLNSPFPPPLIIAIDHGS